MNGRQEVRNKSSGMCHGKSAHILQINMQPQNKRSAQAHHRHIDGYVNDLPHQPDSKSPG